MATADKIQQIANGNARIISERDAISEAIAGKGVAVPENAKLGDLAPLVDLIEQGGTPTPITPTGLWLNVVYLTDAEGYMVQRFPITRGEVVTLPTLGDVPESTVVDENWHPAMTFRGWAAPFSGITNNNFTVPLNQVLDITVGALYTPTDDTTYIVVNIPTDNYILYNTTLNGTKDWGDGSSDTGANHTYAEKGLYVIKNVGTTTVTRVNNRATSVWMSNTVTSIAYNALNQCYMMKSVSLPLGIGAIASSAFQNCTSLAGVILPPLSGGIGQNGFRSCYNMEYVVFSSDCPTIGQDSFNSCTSWALVTLPENCSDLAKGSMSSVGMSKMQIPSTVTSLVDYLFYNNYGCFVVVLDSSTPPTIGSNRATPNITTIYLVPEGSRDAYISATNWAALAPYIYENTEANRKKIGV